MNWPLGRIAERDSHVERVDSHDVTDAELEEIFDFYHAVGTGLGGYGIVTGFLSRASRRWSGTVSVLDLGCGRGDLGRAIVDWSKRKGLDVRVHGADKYGRLVHLARDRHRGVSELTFDVRDLNDPLFLQAQQFDYVVSAGALHREPESRVLPYLKTANRLAKRGVIVADWIRDARAAFFLGALANIGKNADVAGEAKLAVRRGFRLKEAVKARDDAGMEYARVMAHFGYRFSIHGERALAMDAALSPVAGLAT